MTVVQLIMDSPAAGSWNMAVDEVLLLQAAQTGLSYIRFYAWERPTLTLGYFQHYRDRTEHAASRKADCVRRQTGGGAILHDRELTYSFVTPDPRRHGAAEQLYTAWHETLVSELQARGIAAHMCTAPQHGDRFLCFQRHCRGDVLVGGDKVAGSAQRRRHGALLQHGSVLLEMSALAPELPGIAQLAACELTGLEVARSWLRRVEQGLRIRCRPASLGHELRHEADRLAGQKYGDPQWNQRR